MPVYTLSVSLQNAVESVITMTNSAYNSWRTLEDCLSDLPHHLLCDHYCMQELITCPFIDPPLPPCSACCRCCCSVAGVAAVLQVLLQCCRCCCSVAGVAAVLQVLLQCCRCCCSVAGVAAVLQVLLLHCCTKVWLMREMADMSSG